MVSSPYVEINPEDARMLSVTDGQKVKVSSRRGSIEIAVRVSQRPLKGVVFIPFHFKEAAANALTNTALDPICKIPELKVCAVRIEKSAAPEAGFEAQGMCLL
jgi:predicted molibdopterin-dependent oxidoreductase YjgC